LFYILLLLKILVINLGFAKTPGPCLVLVYLTDNLKC